MAFKNQQKLFEDVKVEDSLFLVDPSTGEIVSTKVRATKVLIKRGRHQVVQIKIYKLTAFDKITDEKLEETNKELGTKVDWTLRMFGHETLGMVNLPDIKLPTVICTTKEELELWMKQTGPGLKKKSRIIYP